MGKWFFLGEFKLQKKCNQSCSSNLFQASFMLFRLVHASYSLPEWQAVKLTSFAPWLHWKPVSLTVLQTSFLLFLTFEMTWYNATQIIGNICLILSCSIAIHKLQCISQVPSQTWMVIKWWKHSHLGQWLNRCIKEGHAVMCIRNILCALFIRS